MFGNSKKDKSVAVVTKGTMRANGRGLTCRSCGGTTGWGAVTQNGRTVIRHSCGAIQ